VPHVHFAFPAPVLVVALALACQRPDSVAVVHPLESTLGTAVPAAFVATAAMSALGGTVSPCATIVPQGSADGGLGTRVDVHLGPGCPAPFGEQETGTMVVTGVWTPALATFLADFTQVQQGSSNLLVLKIATMTVVPNGTHLLVSYLQQDVEAASGATASAGLQQTAWVVDVDTRGTASPADDVLSISGGDQSLLAVSGSRPQADITQVAVANAVFQAGCRRNPGEGFAAVQRAGTLGGGWLFFTFHPACDGRVDVTGAMAPYELMLGRSVPLAFLQ
jgi:hypothetical protein